MYIKYVRSLSNMGRLMTIWFIIPIYNNPQAQSAYGKLPQIMLLHGSRSTLPLRSNNMRIRLFRN
jgi:hypothetical protein